MSFSLNRKKLTLSLLGAAGVITGVCLKNGFEQLKAPAPNFGSKYGPMVFGLGWALTGLAIAAPKAGKAWLAIPKGPVGLMALAASAGVFISVMQIKGAKKMGQKPASIFPAMFAGSWALLALALMKQSNFARLPVLLAVASVGLVLGSMWKVLPWQRKAGVVDWFGMPMFTTAWGCVAAANALA